MESDKVKEKLINIGLEPKFVESSLNNKKLCDRIIEVLEIGGVQKCEKKIGTLLYNVASSLPQKISQEDHKKILIKYIAEEKIFSQFRYKLAVDYLSKHFEQSPLDVEGFEKGCGVGVVVEDKDVIEGIQKMFEQNKEELDTKRYTINLTEYLKQLRESMPFGEPAVVTQQFNRLLKERLGEETEQDKRMKEDLKKDKSKKDKQKVQEGLDKIRKKNDNQEVDEDDNSINMYNIAKYVARDLGSAVNTSKLIEEHLKVTNGKVFTRFPPEPNGYLHIGHAKAMRFSFMVAKQNQGHCYLRFDDTNPEKESKEYIDNIIENVKWLGYDIYKITHASDYFDRLYEMAVKLIKKDKAYVCDQNKAQMKEYRDKGWGSPNREKPVEQNLKEFENMKLGMYEEGEVVLRLKIDPKNPNPNLRDPAIYRIKYVTHPHVGDKWCIYPLYDFTHGLCDSFENVTHSLCTLEFEIRRDLYYWILEQCEVFRPNVWEYSRMNLSNTVVSKRKLQQLVFDGHVNGWDDPRLPTVNGLRRRGYTATAINRFCDLMSVSRRGNENFINISNLETCLKKELDITARRAMGVIQPVKMEIEGIDQEVQVDAPFFPKRPEKGNYKINLSSTVYVDRIDIKADDKGKFGIFENRIIGLKYGGHVLIKTIERDSDKQPLLIKAQYLKDNKSKPFGYFHWISQKDAIKAEIRYYELLITAYNPNTVENFLDIVNKNSMVIYKNSLVNRQAFTELEKGKSIQLERIGYFCIDKDSTEQNLVLNRATDLTE